MLLNDPRIKIMDWVPKDHRWRAFYLLGSVPQWLLDEDPRPAREQLNERYKFGGWQPLSGVKVSDDQTGVYKYPGDPPQRPFAVIEFRDEKVFAYQSEFWGILSKDGGFELARMD